MSINLKREKEKLPRMTPAIRLDRLNDLSYMLKHHDQLFQKGRDVRFNISSWLDRVNPALYLNRSEDLASMNVKTLQTCQINACGTSACALGSAALYQPFVKQGLSLGGSAYNARPRFGEYEGFVAGAKFFGISAEEAVWLFSPDAYRVGNEDVTPAMVAGRVDALIKHYSTKNTPKFSPRTRKAPVTHSVPQHRQAA